MSDKPTAREVVEKLQTFEDAEHLAKFLVNEGVLGHRGCPEDCPIAVYVQRETGERHVAVSGSYVFAGRPDRIIAHTPVGTTIHHFVLEFDRGSYTDLIVGGED